MPIPRSWSADRVPLGATMQDGHVVFRVFAGAASQVDLCLLDRSAPERRVPMRRGGDGVWETSVAVPEGQEYGFRACGTWNPEHGLRFNPNKLLSDPYARAFSGTMVADASIYGHDLGRPDRPSALDSADSVPHSVVVGSDFDWNGDRSPAHSWADTVIYEMHVKGSTALHPDIPAPLRGTYAGVAHPAFIDRLLDLGVTAVELLPVHQFVTEPYHLRRHATNFWGYNSLGFFAPHNAYSASGEHGQQVNEFKEMVKALHSAGVEVLLDVVYNHTAEGGHDGPTLSLRGLDNVSYYRMRRDQPSLYADYTGCGNTLDARHPRVVQLILDSLRYWVLEMHVDGFRFDLASALARTSHDVNMAGPLMQAISQDPVLSQVKLIAEPWDLGENGYQLGHFPAKFSEWNGAYRDSSRSFWLGGDPAAVLPEIGARLTGSADLFRNKAHGPHASINFVTCHDGFTLQDLVSYDHKHNLANGEDNRDGESHNRSWNCGVEGPTDDEAVLALRDRLKRSMLATLLLSPGVPMLLAGDEISRSQGGNNNAYCQDNPISWVDYGNGDSELYEFVKAALSARRELRVLRTSTFFSPAPAQGSATVSWFDTDASPMSSVDWQQTNSGCVAALFDPEEAGQSRTLMLLNGSRHVQRFVLPDGPWRVALSSQDDIPRGEALREVALCAGAFVLLT